MFQVLPALLTIVVLGLIALGQIAMTMITAGSYAIVGMLTLCGPLMIPFYVLPGHDKKFWTWFDNMLAYSMYVFVGSGFIFIFCHSYLDFFSNLHGYSVGQWLVSVPYLMLITVVFLWTMLKVPEITPISFSVVWAGWLPALPTRLAIVRQVRRDREHLLLDSACHQKPALTPTNEPELAQLPVIRQDEIAKKSLRPGSMPTAHAYGCGRTEHPIGALSPVYLWSGGPARQTRLHQARSVRARYARPVFRPQTLHAGCCRCEELSRRLGYLPLWAPAGFGTENLPQKLSVSQSKPGSGYEESNQRENVVATFWPAANRKTIDDPVDEPDFVRQAEYRAIGRSAAGRANLAFQRPSPKIIPLAHSDLGSLPCAFFSIRIRSRRKARDHPDCPTINPLGLTIVEFIANRANVEATPKP